MPRDPERVQPGSPEALLLHAIFGEMTCKDAGQLACDCCAECGCVCAKLGQVPDLESEP